MRSKEYSDAFFQACSNSCGKQLQAALREEMDLGDALSQPGGGK